MSEDRLVDGGNGGRTADLLVRPQDTFKRIMSSPDLDTGGTTPPPPEEEDGGRRPDPDPFLVGLMSFMVGFCGMTAVRYAIALAKVLS